MKVDKSKMDLAMARCCLGVPQLAHKAEMPAQTVNGALRGRNIRPATLGKLAHALGVDPEELLEGGDKNG